MALTYTPIRPKSSYMAALGGNPRKIADFNIVYSSVTAIDLQDLVNRYNALETTANVPALTTLKTDVEAALSVIEGLKHSYSDVDVLAPANDMRMRLSTVKSNTETRIKFYSSRLGRSPLGQAITAVKKAKSFVKKVGDGYNKFTGPAEGLFNAANGALNDGGTSIYKKVDKFGKRK